MNQDEIVNAHKNDFDEKVAKYPDENKRKILKINRRKGKNRNAAKNHRIRKKERLRKLYETQEKLMQERTSTSRERRMVLEKKDLLAYHVRMLVAEVKRLKRIMRQDGMNV